MPEIQTGWHFVSAGAIAVFVLLEVALRAVEGKRDPGWRGEVMTFAVIFVAVGSVQLLARLAAPVMAAMPSQAQAVVASRAGLLIFLFWLVMFALPGLIGVCALVASFSILGWVKRPDRHPIIRVRSPFAEEFWTVVAARERLSDHERVVIWVHHALFGVALVLTAGVGMLMTFGLPKELLWPYLAIAILTTLLLNPARSDRRMLARLTRCERSPQAA